MSVNQQAGFTLIEAMVVVAIIAIIASIAVPSFSQSLSEKRTQQAASDIINAFNEARSQAALSGKAAELLIDSDKRLYTVQFLDRAPKASTETSSTQKTKETVVAKKTTTQYQLIDRITVDTNASSKTIVLPNGRIDSGTLYFRVCDNAYSGESGYTVTINPLGVSRQLKGKVSITDDTTANSITNVDCG